MDGLLLLILPGLFLWPHLFPGSLNLTPSRWCIQRPMVHFLHSLNSDFHVQRWGANTTGWIWGLGRVCPLLESPPDSTISLNLTPFPRPAWPGSLWFWDFACAFPSTEMLFPPHSTSPSADHHLLGAVKIHLIIRVHMCVCCIILNKTGFRHLF